MVNYQALIDRQTELTEEIALLQTLDKKAAKAIVKRLQSELSEVDSTIQKNQKAIDLQKVTADDSFKKLGPALLALMQRNSIDYNVRASFDFNFATGTVNATIKPATLRGSRDTVIVYNGKEMPAEITVNLSDNKHETRKFKLVKRMEPASEFTSYESLYQTFLACYGDLASEVQLYNSDFQQRTGKKSRFDSASAKTGKLQRLTQNTVDLVQFADSKPTGKTGNATEAASQAVG
jgi:hypothetical protein